MLVPNRGETAIWALRTAYELGARTVAGFPYADRWLEHLDPEGIVAVALRAGADG